MHEDIVHSRELVRFLDSHKKHLDSVVQTFKTDDLLFGPMFHIHDFAAKSEQQNCYNSKDFINEKPLKSVLPKYTLSDEKQKVMSIHLRNITHKRGQII